MTQNELILTGSLARAARALVKTSSMVVAQRAGLSRDELREFEKRTRRLTPEQLIALQQALESLGAVFITDGHKTRGHGVRLKFTASGSAKVDSWEGEGGFAAEDDV